MENTALSAVVYVALVSVYLWDVDCFDKSIKNKTGYFVVAGVMTILFKVSLKIYIFVTPTAIININNLY